MTMEQISWNSLGKRTFLILFLRLLGLFAFFVVIFIGGLFYLTFAPVQPSFSQSQFLSIGMGILFIIFILTLLFAWLEYRHYAIKLTDEGLRVRRGLLSVRLNGVSYHRIRDVVTSRSFVERLFGISTVVVNLVGDADNVSGSYPMNIRMEALSREVADRIHDELLKRIEAGDPF